MSLTKITGLYKVDVFVGNYEHSGTTKKVEIILYRNDETTSKLSLGSSFKKGETTSVSFDMTKYEVGDVGAPFAIGLIKETGNNAIWIDKVTVLHLPGQETSQDQIESTSVEFIFNGALGNKGDQDLPEQRKSIVLFADGHKASKGTENVVVDVDEIWVIQDNRKESHATSESFCETRNYSVTSLFSQQNTTMVKVMGSVKGQTGSFFRPGYKWSLGLEASDILELTKTNTTFEGKGYEIIEPWSVDPNHILFMKIVVKASQPSEIWLRQHVDTKNV